MILLTLGLFAFAVTDLLRWSTGPVSKRRGLASIAGGTGVAVAIAALSGFQVCEVVMVGLCAIVVLTAWTTFGHPRPIFAAPSPDTPLPPPPKEGDEKEESWNAGYPLAGIASVLAVLFAASGSAGTITGPLETWYSNLAFPFVDSVSLDQFVLGVSAGLFLLSTANRIVRLVLDAAGTPASRNEDTLRGGRLLGPMERLVVGAMVLSGDPAGAALVIAAKGLLRLPEIRDSTAQENGQDDHVTEYFLIGTFTSLLLAAGAGLVVLGAG